MKVPSGAADRFVSRPDANIFAVLLYGPDQGLVKERAEGLGRTVVSDLSNPFNVVELTGSVLKDDPARLSDESNALSFAGGRRLVRLREASDSVAKVLESYLLDPSPSALVVVEADELGPRSPLRILFEAHGSAASIACYASEGQDLQRTAEQMLSAHNVSVDKDALHLLGQILGADRALVRNEVDKLALYVGAGNRATIEDVDACLVSTGTSSLDQIAFCAADGNAADADRHYQQALKEGVSEIAVLRALQRHFQRLDLVVAHIAAGSSAGSAVSGLKPPVFFKFKDRFERQVRRWTPDRAHHALGILTDAESACKSTGTPVEIVCGRAIMAVSRMG